MIEPHPPVKSDNRRPRKAETGDVVDAVLFILRTGCQWHYLFMGYPPRNMVWRQFDRWGNDGPQSLLHACHREVLAVEKRNQPLNSAIADSQSFDTTTGGEAKGCPNYKNVNSCKRYIVLHSIGLLRAILVTALVIADAEAWEVFARLESQSLAKVARIFVFNKYHNKSLSGCLEANANRKLANPRRSKGPEGSKKQPIRLEGPGDKRLARPVAARDQR